MSSVQQGNIYNVWHPIRKYPVCKRKNSIHNEEDNQSMETDRELAESVEITDKDIKSYNNCISDVPMQCLKGYTNIRKKNRV